jgi:hypothetical protein
MKQFCIFIICLLIINYTQSERDKFKFNSLKKEKDLMTNKEIYSESIKNSILWEGWIKYLHYTSSAPMTHPNNFYKNNEFFAQKIHKSDLQKKDQKGFVNIPTQFHFYSKLMNNYFNILKSRSSTKDEIKNNIESIHLDNLLPIDTSLKFKGSIQDLGNFSEGFCIQIFTNSPGSPKKSFNSEKDIGNKENWIICVDSLKEKENLIVILVNQKLSKQKELKNNPSKINNKIPETLASLIATPTQIMEKRSDHNSLDGYVILLQDWSQCTLKCGGGKSYQHWMCIPPKKDGRPCEGKTIREKDCNKQPCTGTISNNINEIFKPKNNMEKVAEPVFKFLPFSERKQNFIKCLIKESDVFYLTKDTWTQNSAALVPMPSRIIMNNRTISLYNDDSYQSNIFSFDLGVTEIGAYNKDPCCFSLMSNTKEYYICGGFGSRCDGFMQEWKRDFSFFKQKCYLPQKSFIWHKEEVKQATNDALNAANLDNLEERTNLIKKKLHEKELSSFDKQITYTQNTALKAIKKEMNIEQMLTREVQLKAMLETKTLLDQKKQEEKKRTCLERAFKEREVENNRLLENKKAQVQMEKIKDDVRKEVEQKRLALRNKIDEIQKKALRRKKMIEQDINTIRGQMARNIIDANKNGDMNKCNIKEQEKINSYCDENIVDDFNKNFECKQSPQFCYICCEHEFGNMVLVKRDECYKICDELLKYELATGEFKWS